MMNAAPSPDDQQFCLRWNNHQTTIIANFDSLLQNSMLVDCTLAAEGRIVKAHKVVLSACSPYFATLLIQNYDKHPIFILKDVKFKELEAMMDYMYRGEVNVSQDQLPYLLKAAESLQIKGLSDRGSSGEPKPEDDEDQREHRGMNVPGGIAGVKLPGGYTLEQAHVTPASKRVRIGGAPPSSMDTQNVSGSREGSSSPSRRRRKVRRRSIENAMTAEVHDNSNSSQIQSNQSLLLLQQQQQQQQSNASLAGVGAITAAASALASQIPVSGATASAGTTAGSIAQVGGTTAQQMTTSGGNGGVTKKTENVKGTSDAMNTENIQAAVGGAVGGLSSDEHMKSEKQNHKQQKGATGSSNKDKDAAETMVIEPKSEYDEEGNDETVEDLTLDDEEMGMDDLDQNAGTSQGGEGSSQGYAPWQHERSQDELLLATQEQQQRDPQAPIDLHIPVNNGSNNAIQKIAQCSILNSTNKQSKNHNSSIPLQLSNAHIMSSTKGQLPNAPPRKARRSVADVSKMLLELSKAKAPKNEQQNPLPMVKERSPTSAETNEPSTIAAIATTSAAVGAINFQMQSKNLQRDEMMMMQQSNTNSQNKGAIPKNTNYTSFHPRRKYTKKALAAGNMPNGSTTQPIRTSVVVMPSTSSSSSSSIANQMDLKPFIIGPTINPAAVAQSVIKLVPPVAVGCNLGESVDFAAALRNYNLNVLRQEQLQVQQQQQQQQQQLQQHQEHQLQQHKENNTAACKIEPTNNVADVADNDANEGIADDEDSRFNSFDDIHLVENTRNNQSYNNLSLPNIFNANALNVVTSSSPAGPSDFIVDFSQAQAQALRHLALAAVSVGNGVGNDMNNDVSNAVSNGLSAIVSNGASNLSRGGGNRRGRRSSNDPTESNYVCKTCGKHYRWKSTLRRHENVECGGKAPANKCPYCDYKAKQHGNLGVHIRKHHPTMPQLGRTRRSKFSRVKGPDGRVIVIKNGDADTTVTTSDGDESSSRLVIDNTVYNN